MPETIGKYRVVERVGRGGMGMIFKAHDPILDRQVALKVISPEVEVTRTGLIMGTLRYISPEQVRGRVDHRSDMFSIGSVFYELLTLRPPFLGEDAMQLLEQLRTEDPPSPSEIDPTIPAELTAV